MRYVFAAHAVHGSGGTRPDRIGIAAGMLGGYGDGPIGTAHDGALVVKGIGGAEIQDKPRVLGRASEGEGGASLDAEGFVGLGAGDTRSRFKFLVLYVWRYYEYFCQRACRTIGA